MTRNEARALTVKAKELRDDIATGNGSVNWTNGVWSANLNKENHVGRYAAMINRVHWHNAPTKYERHLAVERAMVARTSNLWG